MIYVFWGTDRGFTPHGTSGDVTIEGAAARHERILNEQSAATTTSQRLDLPESMAFVRIGDGQVPELVLFKVEKVGVKLVRATAR